MNARVDRPWLIAMIIVMAFVAIAALCSCGGKRKLPEYEPCYVQLTIENDWRWGVDVRSANNMRWLVQNLQPAQEVTVCLRPSDLHNGVIELLVRPDGYGAAIPSYHTARECGAPLVREGMSIKFTVETHYNFACGWL